ncbi:nudC domain-containing protein 1-like [Centruroides sculpturatus]|uniref:nudC domain-containing protein 1-like n=1 Tax=Centruroides sculpturatus TaxID=218467 RepID=UPI000C6D3AB1|nr:nudC domain-containing protein 1-like [Centruroides sculpturatus]
MATRLDLRPNRNLLDSKFESYRLSLDPLPILKQNLQEGVQNVDLGEDRFSYLEICMSGLFNHLNQDPWALNCLFYVNESHHICWICLSQDGRLTDRKFVWQIPVESGNFSSNASISFPGMEWAVVSNGSRTIYILNTPSRSQGEPWQLCFTYEVDGCSSQSLLFNSIYSSYPSRNQIDCVLAHISKPHNVQGSCKLPETTIHFILVLEWLTFTCAVGNDNNVWNLKRLRRLVGSSIPNYVVIEPGGSALCLATEKEFSFIYDSGKQEEITVEEQKVTILLPLYTYIQSMEDVNVIFRLPENINTSDISVIIQSSHLEVKFKGKTVLEGPLCNTVNVDASTWIVDGEKLEITLSKSEVGLLWSELVIGNTRGEEVMDPSLVAEIHNRLAHLTSEVEVNDKNKPPFNAQQLEECDISNEFFLFMRLDGNTHRVTHHVMYYFYTVYYYYYSLNSESANGKLV